MAIHSNKNITTMRKLLHWLHSIASVLLMISCVLIISITLFAFSVLSTLRNPRPYVELIHKQDAAERSRGLLVSLFVSYALQSGASNTSFLADYPLQTWESVAEVLVPKDWLETNAQMVVNAIFDWLDHPDRQAPQFQFDLSPIIQTLRGPQGALAILPLLDNITTCPHQVQEIIIMGDNLVSCLPNNQDITSIAQKISQQVADRILEEVSLTTLQQAQVIQDNTIQIMIKIRQGVYLSDRILNLGFRLSLLAISLYALLHASSLKCLISSLPLLLYLSAGLSLLLLGVTHLFLNFGLSTTLTTVLPYLEPEVKDFLVDSVHSMSRGVEKEWLLVSIGLLSTAIVIQVSVFAIDRLLTRRTHQRFEASAPRKRIRRQFR
jgi:hypothetical protein